jgi:hypothetical protein
MWVNILAVLADWRGGGGWVPEATPVSLAFLTSLLKNTSAYVITQCVLKNLTKLSSSTVLYYCVVLTFTLL